ncbi:MAG: alginate export family protein [Phycisphaerae bacterium]|nr:alginate export family protein [Phycisphaerae bacterium]
MKQQAWRAGLVVAIVIAVAGSAAFAAAAAPAPTKDPTAPAAAAKEPTKESAAPAAPAHEELLWPEFWQTFHDPAPWLHMGLDQRLRLEAGQSMQTLNKTMLTDHHYLYERYRTRWWTKWDLDENVSFNTRLVWEFRTWEQPENKNQWLNPIYPGYSTHPSVTHFNPDEALFDWFNVNIRNLAGLPLTATIGRQDLAFGVGWLILDATPLDGSRTVGAFDAARFTYDWAEIDTKVDAVYVNNYPESDRWLKPINDQDRGLMEQEEQAAILYLTNTTWKPVQLEGYFIYKQDRPLADGKMLTNLPPWWAEKGEVYTFGGAVSGMAAEHWKYRAEGAVQTGRKAGDLPDTPHTATGTADQPTKDLLAFGTLDTLEYQFKDAHDNATHVTYEYDSGDDPGTADRDERFDLLWGHWPRWSELFIFTYANETRYGDMVNLHRANIGHRINLTKQWQLTGDVHFLWADHNSGAAAPTNLNLSPDKKFRGTLLAPTLKYKMNSQLSAYALFEYFVPGGYYVAPSDDDAWFFRFNFEYVF